MRVFLSAGEASGDAYAAALIREMRRLAPKLDRAAFSEIVTSSSRWPRPPSGATPATSSERERADLAEIVGYDLEAFLPRDFDFGPVLGRPWSEVPEALFDLAAATTPDRLALLEIEGIGGPRMRGEGALMHADTTRWGAISIVQSVAAAPRALSGYYDAKRQLRRGTPGLFVPIDFGYANIRLARHAKNQGWKVMYFVPPGSWRRDRQGKDLPAITDAIATPFAWSAEILRKMGANAHWFGHPIKQLLRESGAGVPPAGRAERVSIAVLPGSRKHEISENLPVIAEALRSGIDAPVEFALAPTVDVAQFRRRWEALAPGRAGDVFTSSDTAGVLRRARAAIVCSGTATLEAALCRCPLVVVYRVSRTMEIEAKLIGFKRPKYIALPNILLDRDVVPELVQDEASPSAVRTHLQALLAEGDAWARQLADFDELDALLGPDDAITRAAALGLSL
jgi:lipid-A-disaccharide synthase